DGIRDYKVTGVQTCALPILPQVPLAAGLPVDGGLLERLDALGEVPAHDHRVRPEIAHDVGGDVRGQRAQGRRARQQRVDEVVLRSEERRVGKEGRSRWWGGE